MLTQKISIPGLHKLEDADTEVVKSFALNQIEKIREISPNEILQDDIFLVLQKSGKAEVFFAPFGEQTNIYAFHLERIICDKETNLTVINTSKTLPEQVFAAAHELGHCLHLERIIKTTSPSSEYIEGVMNRFASEILMPEDVFKKSAESLYDFSKGVFTVSKLSRSIVFLMAQFCVPCKAVIIRLAELNIINFKEAEQLVNFFQTQEKPLDVYIKEAGLEDNLKKPTKRLYLNNITKVAKELLDSGKISKERAEKVFSIVGINSSEYKGETVQIPMEDKK